MVTRTAPNNNQAQFENLLKRWEARWRLRRIVLYLPRVLMAAMGIGILATLMLGIFRVLSPTLMVGVVSGGIAAAVVIVSGALRLFGKGGIEAARQFDRVFGLQERVSTAMELIEGRIKSAPELTELQVADAMKRAQNVDPRKHIKIEVKWLEWLGVVALTLVLAIILGAYVLLASRQGGDVSEATETAIQQAAADVRDITEDVATDSALTDDERSNLLETLEVTLDDLSDEEASAEDSFVAMSELEADLSELAEKIDEEVATDEAALAAAAEALRNPVQPTDASEQPESQASLSEQLEEMQDSFSQLTPEQQAELLEQLNAAAQALEGEFPELAEQLRQLAENAEIGSSTLTPEQLQQALENLEALQNNLQQRSELAESLEQAAQQAQQNAEDIAQADAQQGQQNQEGQQAGQEGQQQGQQAGEGGQQQQGLSSTLSQTNNLSQANAIIESPDGQPQDGQMQSQQAGGEGGGSGEGEANSRQEGLGNQSQPLGENQADGQGETTYEEIYAPNPINASGRDNVILDPDASDSPAVEGDFQENPTGETTVPYNQVFRTYEDAANRALENDYVPLGMQDVVRDYFSSLQPTGDNQP